MTSFALGEFVFQKTGSPTQFALIGLFAVIPKVIFSPVAGTIIDRWDHRKVMILADVGAGLSTLVIPGLLFSGQLDLWHIYLASAASALFGAFQWPAYTATVTTLVPKEQLGRANGMNQLGQAAAEILAPSLAGVLVLTIQLEGVILIDVITFFFAIITLLLVRFPKMDPVPSEDGLAAFKDNLVFGWQHILTRKGLLNLLYFQATVNFIWGMVGALIGPMILSFTSPDQLGAIIIAIVFGSNQALWQTKVEPENQGRVFATQQMFASIASPLAYLLAGPLAEKIFEPFIASGGTISQQLGQMIGPGVGRGIGLMFVLMGLAKVVVSNAGYLNPHMRRVEDDLPDAI